MVMVSSHSNKTLTKRRSIMLTYEAQEYNNEKRERKGSSGVGVNLCAGFPPAYSIEPSGHLVLEGRNSW